MLLCQQRICQRPQMSRHPCANMMRIMTKSLFRKRHLRSPPMSQRMKSPFRIVVWQSVIVLCLIVLIAVFLVYFNFFR